MRNLLIAISLLLISSSILAKQIRDNNNEGEIIGCFEYEQIFEELYPDLDLERENFKIQSVETVKKKISELFYIHTYGIGEGIEISVKLSEEEGVHRVYSVTENDKQHGVDGGADYRVTVNTKLGTTEVVLISCWAGE